MLFDAKQIELDAKKELSEERAKIAKDKLKDLYTKREKALLAVRNIDREIDAYLADVQDNVTYQTANVNLDS